jgi:hypothetical protein
MEPGQHFMVPDVVHKFQTIRFRGVSHQVETEYVMYGRI